MESNEIFELDDFFFQSFEDIVEPLALDGDEVQNNEFDSFIFDDDFIREIESMVVEPPQQEIVQHIENIATTNKRKRSESEQIGGGLEKKVSKSEEDKRVYSITKKYTRKNKFFNHEENVYALDLHNKTNQTFDEALKDMKNMFEQLYNDFVKDVQPQDHVKMTFEHDLFKSSIYIPFLKPADYSPELIMNAFERIVQSYKLGSEEMQPKHRFTARIAIMHLPAGKGKRTCKEKRDMTSFEKFLHTTKSIKVVENIDSLCAESCDSCKSI